MVKENCVINPLTNRAILKGSSAYNRIKHLLPKSKSEDNEENIKQKTPPKKSSYKTPPLASSKSEYKTAPLASSKSSYKTAPLASSKSSYKTAPLASSKSSYKTAPLASSKSEYKTAPLASSKSKYKTAPLASSKSKYKTAPLASSKSSYKTAPLASSKSEYKTAPLASSKSSYKTAPLASSKSSYKTAPLASSKSSYKTPPLGTSYKKNKDTPLIDNIKILQNFFKKKLIKDRYSLKNRIAFTKYVENKIKSISAGECAKPYTFPDGSKGYTINNIIYLNKIIGTPSEYGKIYISTIKNSFGGFAMVAKMMKDNKRNLKEIELMYNITNKLITSGKSKHFIINVGSFHCMKKNENKANEKLLAINELAHGDLNMIVNDPNIFQDEKLIINIFIQIYISIATFQIQTKHAHKDCHWGNFLYQKNNDEGWYKYTFNDNTFYLKACGYNMAIYDFGLSIKIKDEDAQKAIIILLNDYQRIIHAFISKKNKGWNENEMPPLVNSTITNLKEYLLTNPVQEKIINNQFKNQVDLFNFLYNNVFKVFFNDFSDIITDVKPTGKIINEESPFIIN